MFGINSTYKTRVTAIMKSIILALWATTSLVGGYRILCVFPVPAPSHNILGKGIVDALLEAGHQVWWATPYPEKMQPAANLTIIDVRGTQVAFEKYNMSSSTHVLELPIMGAEIASIAASKPGMFRTMVDEDFDAVITEWFGTDLPAGYAAVQQVPWVMLSSTAAHPYLELLVDDVTSTPLAPVFLNHASVPMNFWQRLANSLLVGIMKIAFWISREFSSSQYIDLFGPIAAARGVSLPPLSEVYNNVSVLLINSHPTLALAQRFPPNVVDIAGYHVRENGSLPQDLKDLLDSSTQGFLYFSLGSLAQMSDLPVRLKKELANMFGELPYTVLWKSDEELEDLPKNVHARKWFPQGGILAHRNIKLFITHSGLLSTTEAVHYGVPLLAVPVFGDQPTNAQRAVDAGFAVKVDFHSGMASELGRGIREMVNNERYYNTAKHLSRLYHKRPVPPAKLIPHYVELAIESQGAYHLRSAARHYSWLARTRLDQLAVCAGLLYSLYAAARIGARQLRGSKRKTE